MKGVQITAVQITAVQPK